jgi:hypothetical protein
MWLLAQLKRREFVTLLGGAATTFLIEFKLSPVVLVEGTSDRGIVREC